MLKAFWTVLSSLVILTGELKCEEDFDFILTNGPSISIPVVFYFWTRKLWNLLWKGEDCSHKNRIIFIESITRVRRLSLSARIVHPFVDEMIVWWPELQQFACGKCRRIDLIKEI